MSTQTDNLEEKIQSLQQSLLFLQEQHQSTLNGLHEEISKLQQKCSSLIFQLTQAGLQPDVSAGTEAEPFLTHKEVLENELKQFRHKHLKVKDSLEVKEEKILKLEAQAKSKEQKYLNDLKHYQRKVAELQNELEHKSASIAYLTTKLHQSKLKDDSTSETVKSSSLKPSPPSGNPNRQHERKNIRGTVKSPAANVAGLILESTSYQSIQRNDVLENSLAKSNTNIANRLSGRYKHSICDPVRPSLGHSQSRHDRDKILFNKPKPSDYEDFIKISQSDEIVGKPLIEPLPPITPRLGKHIRQSRKDSLKGVIKDNSSTAGAVETIIIETTLASPERPYGTLQDLS